MENLAHSLTGALLGRVGLGKKVPWGTPALVVAANLPDADSVAGFWGSLFYLHHHRGITHSLLGILVIGLLYSGLLMGLNRLGKQPVPVWFGGALLSIYLVLATHPLMDFTNSYGLRPFLPFQDRWYYGDLVFIVDPYLWLILGGGLLLTKRRGTVGRILWMTGGGVLTLLIVRYAGADPQGKWVLVIWLLSLMLLLGLKRKKVVWSPKIAAGALLAMVVYWILLLGLRETAVLQASGDIAQVPSAAQSEAPEVLPRLANPFEWDLFLESPKQIYHSKVSVFRGLSPNRNVYSRNRDHPAVAAALTTCPGAVMAHFSRFETFQVVPAQQGPEVILRDVRYARAGRRSGFGIVTVPMTPDLERSRLDLPCPDYQPSCD